MIKDEIGICTRSEIATEKLIKGEKTKKNIEIQKLENVKQEMPKGNLGVCINFHDDKINISKHNPLSIIMYVKDKQCNELKTNKIDADAVDYIAVFAKCKTRKSLKVQKINILDQKFVREEYYFVSTDGLNKFEKEFHPQIIEKIKTII